MFNILHYHNSYESYCSVTNQDYHNNNKKEEHTFIGFKLADAMISDNLKFLQGLALHKH